MSKRFLLASKFIVTLTFALTSTMRADKFDHSGRNGDFHDGMWINQTTSPPGGPNIFGNPGAGDDAYFYGANITASGGSVHLLSGGTLQLSGMLTATNAGSFNLSGDGTLNVQSIVTDANGFGPLLFVTGGHVMAQNGDGVASVTAGGTVTAATCSGSNGCGFYDGADTSLTITGASGPGHANFANGGKLTANGGLQDFVLGFQSGSTGTVPSIANGQAVVNGVGSSLMVTGDFSLNSQAVTASAGGALTVNGKLAQGSGAPVRITGSGSILTAGQFLSPNGSDFDVAAGGAATVQGALTRTRGQVSLDGGNTTLTVLQDFTLMGGFLDLSAGAALAVNGKLVLDGGTDLDGNVIGGGGHWQGANTTINTSQEMDIGNTTGSFSIAIDTGVTVRTGDAFVGVGASASGTVGLSGTGTLWQVQSGGLAVGANGTGNFNIASGARLLLGGGTAFAVGFNSGSRGRMTVDGAGSSVDASKAATRIGANAGSAGNIVVTNGAQVTFGQDAFIGNAGSGSLSLDSASQISVTGGSNTRFGVAGEAGSAGSISVQGGSNLSVDAFFFIGVGGHGFAGVGTGGMLQSSVVALGGGSGAVGTAVVDGAGSTWNSSSDVFVGQTGGGAGKLTVSSGGTFNVVGDAGHFGIANGAETTGELDVDGSESRVTSSAFIAGVDGAATVRITNAGSLQTGQAAIASSSISSGDVLVSDPGSLWRVTDFALYVGGIPLDNEFSQGGPATLTVANGGLVLVPEVIDIARLGKIVLSGGAVGVGTNANPAPNTLRVAADGLLVGSARVQGQVIVAPGGKILPGNSPGILTIDGNYTQEAGSTFYAEIGGPDPGTGYDQAQVSGQATLAGSLQVRLTNGFTPAVGQTFRILSAGSISGSFASVSQPSQAGVALTSDATGVTVKVTSVTLGAPVINGATTAVARPGTPFEYQIAASNNPSSFGATNLPDGLTIDHNSGIISGTLTTKGAFIVPINANNSAGSGQADLILLADNLNFSAGAGMAPAQLQNISTRGQVMDGDKVLIGGFIVTGSAAKKVIVRGIGPSLNINGAPVPGRLTNPTLKLMQGDVELASNDTWTSNQAEISATGLAPGDDAEAAIVATLPPGSYTALLSGEAGATGIGLVEIYDVDVASASELGNISTRGMVETGDNVLIGGFIIGPGDRSSSQVIVRAIGPSMNVSGIPVPGRLADPTLELVNASGTIIGSNDDWMTQAQAAQITAAGLAPTDPKESALLATLPAGNYTAIVRGAGETSGIGMVEIFHLPPTTAAPVRPGGTAR